MSETRPSHEIHQHSLDASKAKETLDWTPLYTLDKDLESTYCLV